MTDTMPSHVQNMAESGDMGGLQNWIAADPKRLHAKKSNGEGFLHIASNKGHIEMIRYLLDAGLSISVVDSSGYTPLHEAVRGKSKEAIRFLIAEGADLSARLGSDGSKAGKTPLELLENGSPEVVHMLKYGIDHWRMSGKDTVMHKYFEAAGDYSLTEIFNFRRETCTVISRNNTTNNEALAIKTFDELAGTALMEEAEKEFIRLGGTMPDRVRIIKSTKKPGL